MWQINYLKAKRLCKRINDCVFICFADGVGSRDQITTHHNEDVFGEPQRVGSGEGNAACKAK